MLTVEKDDLSNVYGGCGVIYKTVRADGSKGYALVELDESPEDPLADWDCEGELKVKTWNTGGNFTSLNEHIVNELSHLFYNDEAGYISFFTKVAAGTYPNLEIGLVSEADVDYSLIASDPKRCKYVFYYYGCYGDALAVRVFDELKDLCKLDFSEFASVISTHDLYRLYESVFPKRYIIPLRSGSYYKNCRFCISSKYDNCDSYWEFDLDAYRDPKKWPYVSNREELKEWAMKYVEAAIETETFYWNGYVYGVTTCKAEEVDSCDIDAIALYAITHPGLTFDRYKAYRDLINNATSSDSCWGFYGDEAVREAFREDNVVSAEEFLS